MNLRRIFLFFSILTGAVFLPVLICVIFIGNRMDYNEGLKLVTLLPNHVLFPIAVFGVAVCVAALMADRIRLTRRVNCITDGILVLFFVLLYFINFRITREIAFQLPWDIMVVNGFARDVALGKQLGYEGYLSIYPNNIPIVYFLSRLYRMAAKIKDYPYIYEAIWLQVNCALVSLGGLFGCLTVKKLTQRIVPTAIFFFLYLALAGSSPWKTAPYTDVGGLVFPIMCIWFYLCYRDAKKEVLKYIFLFLALAGGILGSLIKPSVLIAVLAILGVELILALTERGRWRYILAGTGFAVILFFAEEASVDYMIREMGLEYREELEVSWQYYIYMGLNEGSTGSDSGDLSIVGEFQTSKRERDAAALERAFGRVQEKGIGGTLWFWMRKMVMVFNDGLFGWGTEVWIRDYYPGKLADNDGFMKLMRDIFWPAMTYTGRYHTLGQLVWIFCLLGIPGICLCPEEERSRYAVMTISFLGIFFYQMLFEARARYLIVFWPVLFAISVCGMLQYARLAGKILRKRRQKAEAQMEG